MGTWRAGAEREAKLIAQPELELPGFDEVVTGVVAAPAQRRRLDAVYYDSPDLTLARSGITLRYRTGEDGPGWTLKLPAGRSGSNLIRRELVFDGPAGTVPAAARDLVRGAVRSRPLEPVVRLHTDRTAVALRDSSGVPVAEVVDDAVSAYAGDRRTGGFREVEVELSDGHPAGARLLRGAVGRLVDAGCRAEPPMPKLVRALGSAAAAPPDLVPPDLGGSPSVGDLIRYTLATSVARMVRHDPGVRLGEDPEDVHQFRVATRRLRSDLQTFAPVLQPAWTRALRAELRWLAEVVGVVRDNDVLTERLCGQARTLPEQDADGVAALLARLAGQGDAARTAMLDALRTARYDTLLDTLVAAAREPAFAAGATTSVHRLVTGVVRRQWRRLHDMVRALSDPPSDTELHQVRILAKRCRYAAEAATPVTGHRAARFAAAEAEVQTVLGDLHDAIVAEAWLRAAAVDVPGCALAAGELIAMQRAENTQLRAAWPAVWRAASARKLRWW